MNTVRFLALLALLHCPVEAFADKAVKHDERAELDALDEQIQIMRLVLTKALNSALLDHYRAEYAAVVSEESADPPLESDKETKKPAASSHQVAGARASARTLWSHHGPACHRSATADWPTICSPNGINQRMIPRLMIGASSPASQRQAACPLKIQ